jgi:hypothetical protein
MATQREVLQMCKDYRAFHSPFGGAIAPEDSHLRTASYGPAGFIEQGMEYPPSVRDSLRDSYEKFDHALKLAKRTPRGMFNYLLLYPVYFGDPADPSIATRWRAVGDHRIRAHDEFIEELTKLLKDHELHPVWPERMRRGEEMMVERRNNDFYEEYLQVKQEKLNEGLSESKANKEAIDIASARHGYRRTRAYEIVKVRSLERAG